MIALHTHVFTNLTIGEILSIAVFHNSSMPAKVLSISINAITSVKMN